MSLKYDMETLLALRSSPLSVPPADLDSSLVPKHKKPQKRDKNAEPEWMTETAPFEQVQDPLQEFKKQQKEPGSRFEKLFEKPVDEDKEGMNRIMEMLAKSSMQAKMAGDNYRPDQPMFYPVQQMRPMYPQMHHPPVVSEGQYDPSERSGSTDNYRSPDSSFRQPDGFRPPLGAPDSYRPAMGQPDGFRPPLGAPDSYRPAMGQPDNFRPAMGQQMPQQLGQQMGQTDNFREPPHGFNRFTPPFDPRQMQFDARQAQFDPRQMQHDKNQFEPGQPPPGMRRPPFYLPGFPQTAMPPGFHQPYNGNPKTQQEQ